jgi:NAD-dependent dihydropyrimidine dehydrogenase PreA subunit
LSGAKAADFLAVNLGPINMIEIVLEDRCIRCAACVRACPTNVYDGVSGELPVIARQEECQTCFLCEAYCPVDALYVSPLNTPDRSLVRTALEASGLVGGFAHDIGWIRGRPPLTAKPGGAVSTTKV